MKTLLLSVSALTLVLSTASHADFVHDDDVIIGTSNNRLCVGLECIDGEAFGNENVKLKDSTPDLLFVDTDINASEWAIDINSSGRNFFRISDLSAGTDPFEIEGGAPTASIHISDSGAVGLGSTLPQAELHILGDVFPALRLEQGSASFQAWELFVNFQGGIGLLDVENGTIPFTVDDDAPNMALRIDTFGNVVLGVLSGFADAPLHIRRTNGTARIYVQEDSAVQAARELFLMENNGGSYFTLKNTNSGRDWFFTHENNVQGRFIITASTNPSKGLFLSDTGNMKIGGVLTENSDRNAKMAIEPVDPAAILAKVAALPVSEWSYTDDAGVRHIGPMAQDFHALFGVGATETGISTLDTSGVALAAIQALEARTIEQDAVIAQLAAENADLKALAASLATRDADQRALLATLAARIEKLEASSD